MRVRVIIGIAERENADIRPDWISEQINRLRSAGEPVCVKVLVNDTDIDLSFATSGCSGLGGGCRKLTGPENKILESWRKLHLNEDEFSPGNMIAFLKQLGI